MIHRSKLSTLITVISRVVGDRPCEVWTHEPETPDGWCLLLLAVDGSTRDDSLALESIFADIDTRLPLDDNTRAMVCHWQQAIHTTRVAIDDASKIQAALHALNIGLDTTTTRQELEECGWSP